MRRRKKTTLNTKGNFGSRGSHVSAPNRSMVDFSFRNESTKFYKRPPGLTNRAMWKKYPIPFVWDNPEPEGDAIIIRKFYPFYTEGGTYVKSAA